MRLRAVLATLALITLVVPLSGSSAVATSTGDFEAIDRYVREQMDGSRIPGVSIAIVEGGRVVHANGFGNDGRGHQVTAGTPFWIGSNTKSITALAVMQLVESGKVDIDAPVVRYLPEFTAGDEKAAGTITVRHLINQTSGFSRQAGIEPLLEGKAQSLEQTVDDIRNVKLNRPVGQSFEYSNLNSVVLGQLIESVSGEKWGSYVQRHVFTPLGMTNSYTSLEEAQRNGLTAVHKYWFGFPIETGGAYLPGLAPSGAIYASASDMARYLSMYLQGGTFEGKRLLSPEGINAMLRAETNEVTRTLQSQEFSYAYGRGWFVGGFGAAEDARWHLGNLPYFTAWMVLLPESNQAVVVLINAGSQFELAGANQVMSRIPIGIVNILRGEGPPAGPGMSRFFLLFDVAVLTIVLLQLASLFNLARRRAESLHGLLVYLPFVWEAGLALVVLAAAPSVFAMSWPHAFASLPDLTLVLLTISVLWLLTAIVRGYKLANRHFAKPDSRLETAAVIGT